MTKRFMGLDVHRDYCVAVAVDAKQQVVYGPRRIPNSEVERWMVKELSPQDAVVLEMTTNTWTMVDLLRPHAESVTVVHPAARQADHQSQSDDRQEGVAGNWRSCTRRDCCRVCGFRRPTSATCAGW